MTNELSKENVMTVKEVAEALGVSTDTVKNCIRRIMPNKMQNGKTTYINEVEASCISRELKNNTKVTEQLTYEAASQVKNSTTRLEILENYKSATEALVKMLEAEKAELAAENEKQKQQLIEQKPLVEGYKLTMSADGTYSMADTAKVLKLGYGNVTLFAKLRAFGILDKKNAPLQEYVNRGYFKVVTKPIAIGEKVENKTVTRVTAKGLDYIAKKLGVLRA